MKKKIAIAFFIFATLLAAFIIIKGKSVEIEKDISLEFNLDSGLKEALYTASLAPSSHNAQNWIVKLSKDNKKISIFLDEGRILKEVDPHKREAYISTGAFVETLIMALKAYGYESQIIVDNDESNNLIATLDYDKAHIENNMEIITNIEKRHTDKRKYKNTDIPKEITDVLLDMNDLYYYPKSTNGFSYIVKGTRDAYNSQAYNPQKQKELAEWLRFSDKQTKDKKDGLPAEQLGLNGIVKILYYLTTNKEKAQNISFIDAGIKKTWEQLNHNSGFFIITGNNNKGDLIKTGMKLQSFWLAATEKNIAIHPMSQMLEEAPYIDEIQEKLGLDKPVQMILRAGLVDDYGKNHKIRRDIKDFVFLED